MQENCKTHSVARFQHGGTILPRRTALMSKIKPVVVKTHQKARAKFATHAGGSQFTNRPAFYVAHKSRIDGHRDQDHPQNDHHIHNWVVRVLCPENMA